MDGIINTDIFKYWGGVISDCSGYGYQVLELQHNHLYLQYIAAGSDGVCIVAAICGALSTPYGAALKIVPCWCY